MGLRNCQDSLSCHNRHPSSAIAALVGVIWLEFTSGPIKMKALGLGFEGAVASEIVGIFYFSATTPGIKVVR